MGEPAKLTLGEVAKVRGEGALDGRSCTQRKSGKKSTYFRWREEDTKILVMHYEDYADDGKTWKFRNKYFPDLKETQITSKVANLRHSGKWYLLKEKYKGEKFHYTKQPKESYKPFGHWCDKCNNVSICKIMGVVQRCRKTVAKMVPGALQTKIEVTHCPNFVRKKNEQD